MREETTKGVSPQQAFQLYGKLGEATAVRFEAGGYWPAVPHSRADDYWLSVSCRRRIHSDWLFLEMTPKVEFPRQDDYEAVPSVTVMVSGLFGEWQD